MFRWINDRDPRQYSLDFGLSKRAVVAQLIEQKFAVKLGLTAVGELLAKLGLTPQKSLQRAYKCNPQALEHRDAKPIRLWRRGHMLSRAKTVVFRSTIHRSRRNKASCLYASQLRRRA